MILVRTLLVVHQQYIKTVLKEKVTTLGKSTASIRHRQFQIISNSTRKERMTDWLFQVIEFEFTSPIAGSRRLMHDVSCGYYIGYQPVKRRDLKIEEVPFYLSINRVAATRLSQEGPYVIDNITFSLGHGHSSDWSGKPEPADC